MMEKNIATPDDSADFEAADAQPGPVAPYPDHPEPTSTEGSSATVAASSNGMLSMVGLGGSAGSISALQEFLTAMPVDSGMAFVVILHLSPEHESTLAELFQRSTAMPVVAAKDKARVEANCVYVIPPGKCLSSVNGHLRLAETHDLRGKRTAVDIFFRSLAETHGPQSVAVVLSGVADDGALGLKRIKECGGLTIAQDPDEAEHSGMPRAAIATGMVDWVLAVKEMPARLMKYVELHGALKLPAEDGPHPAESAPSAPEQDEAALRDVLAFLRTRTGRDFSYYKRATILRRVARRMQVSGLDDLPDYLVYLRTHAGEAGALLQDLLISVTNFFRDPESFTALERIVPELFAGKGPGDSVRVWVAGCATGEEAYSIAILLCEHARTLEAPPQMQVFATDLDEDVIREARDGLYSETIATDVSEERLRRFFLHEQGGYRVRRGICSARCIPCCASSCAPPSTRRSRHTPRRRPSTCRSRWARNAEWWTSASRPRAILRRIFCSLYSRRIRRKERRPWLCREARRPIKRRSIWSANWRRRSRICAPPSRNRKRPQRS